MEIDLRPAPFVFGRIAGVVDFTDREKEREHLITNFSSVVNTVLISPRRWGKSSLVAFATEEAARRNKKLRCCSLDLFSVRTEEEFYPLLAQAVLKATSSKTAEIVRIVGKYLKQFVPKLTISPDPNSSIELGMNWEDVKRNPSDILDLAEKIAAGEGLKLVICIDEFQNVGMFDDPVAFQKKLRASWQRHKHVSYCLYGSKHHMMLEAFADPALPFYKFGDLLFLEKIAEKDWMEFIPKRFKDTGKSISRENAQHIARLVECHPFYAQQVAQLSWFRTKKECTKADIDAAFSSLIDQLGLQFQFITDDLSNTQINFLRALTEGVVHFSAQENLRRYRLGTSANVNRIKDALEEKEIIDLGRTRIDLLDPLYKAWLKKFYFTRRTWQ